MTERRRTAEKNAGAFLSPVGTIAVPMATLDEDLETAPAEPADPGAPAEVRAPRGLIDRLLHPDEPPPADR